MIVDSLGDLVATNGSLLSWTGLGAFIILSVVRGWLVPRRTHEDALHDRDEWRAESRLKDAQIAEKDKQLGHMAEVGEAQKALLTSLNQMTGRGQG